MNEISKKNNPNCAMKYVRSELTNAFNKKLSELILQADSKEKALLLSDEIVEMILIMRNSKDGFQVAISMLDDISNSRNGEIMK